MMGNSDGITGFIGNRWRKTKFMSNYIKVLELFGNRDELVGYLSFKKIIYINWLKLEVLNFKG